MNLNRTLANAAVRFEPKCVCRTEEPAGLRTDVLSAVPVLEPQWAREDSLWPNVKKTGLWTERHWREPLS